VTRATSAASTAAAEPGVNGRGGAVLPALIAEHCTHREPLVDRYAQHLLEAQPGGRDQVVAIVLYGSCLSADTRKTGAFFDFFVIVDSYRDYFARTAHAMVGPVLPPSVFYTVFDGHAPRDAGDTRDTGDTGGALRCKYNVISRAQFIEETGPGASDIHTLGRFSKRVGLVHARDEASRQLVLSRIESAMRTVLGLTLTRLGSSFGFEELLLAQMGISYEGEHRVKEASKVRALLEAERAYYQAAYGALVAERVQTGELRRTATGADGPDLELEQPGAGAPAHEAARVATERFLARSRVRGVCRWPKYVLTVDNWVEIVLDKLERHNGVRLELTPLQRRYPLVFGWGHLARLLREGLIR
jgi:hypothetical protein